MFLVVSVSFGSGTSAHKTCAEIVEDTVVSFDQSVALADALQNFHVPNLLVPAPQSLGGARSVPPHTYLEASTTHTRGKCMAAGAFRVEFASSTFCYSAAGCWVVP